jgi:23S rRNA (adenine-N6)-dimethyltransferase
MKRLPAFSQNFLKNPRFVKELIGHTSIKASDTVYDIGAGSGVVALALAQKCHSVVAVEIDPRIIKTLQANMRAYQNVTIHQADILTMPLPHTPYKVFANIPFSLSAQIVHKLTEAPNPPEVTYLVVQKEFANKLLPESAGFTNQLGITLGVNFAVRVRRHLKPTDFQPVPRIAPVLMEISKRPVPLIPLAQQPMFNQFVVQCFTDPRKFAKMSLQKAGLPLYTRASQLKLSEWVWLFDFYVVKKPGGKS